MSAKTAIQWTDRSWNPVRGCSIVSAGCQHCYAMKQAHRFSGVGQPYEGLTRLAERGPIWTGKIRLVPEALNEPLRWRKPQRIFVNSMSDLFHEDVPDDFIDEVFATMTCCAHAFQILTKRPERMRDYLLRLQPYVERLLETGAWSEVEKDSDDCSLPTPDFPFPNVHLGVSVEDQATADERIPILLQTPAAVRFLSVEPLLEEVDLTEALTEGIPTQAQVDGPNGAHFLRHGAPRVDWVIVGGESGRAARPCSIEWIRSIVRHCKAAAVPCFVKQLGTCPQLPEDSDARLRIRAYHGGDPSEWPEDLRVREFPA